MSNAGSSTFGDRHSAGPFARRVDVVERRLGPEVLVIRCGAQDPVRLAGPPALVWEALGEPADAEELIGLLEASSPAGAPVVEIVRIGLDLLLDAALVVDRGIGADAVARGSG